MILRLWRGWTTREKADGYEELIAAAIFPGILARGIAGLEGLELFRRLAGPNWEVSVVPPDARTVLSRFDEKATHYEGRVTQDQKG